MDERVLTALQECSRKPFIADFQSAWQVRVSEWAVQIFAMAFALFPIALFLVGFKGRFLPAVLLLLGTTLGVLGLLAWLVQDFTAFCARHRIQRRRILGHEFWIERTAKRLIADFPSCDWSLTERAVRNWKARRSEAFNLRIAIVGLFLASYLAEIAARDEGKTSPTEMALSSFSAGLASMDWWLSVPWWMLVGALMGCLMAYRQATQSSHMVEILARIRELQAQLTTPRSSAVSQGIS